MTVTFYDLIKELANRVGDVRNSTATGGSTTTLVDTTLAEANEYYNNGTLLIDQTTPVAVKVSTYASATNTFTLASTLSVAVGAGDSYTAIRSWFPLDVLERSINQAILESEKIMAVDETLTLVADQERYSLPTNVTQDIRRVEIGTEGDDDWKIHYAWRVEGGQLRFVGFNPSDASKTCRIHYVTQQAQMSTLTDELSELVNRDRLITAACKHMLIWRNHKVGRDEPNTTELLNFYLKSDAEKSKDRVSELLARDPILARY